MTQITDFEAPDCYKRHYGKQYANPVLISIISSLIVPKLWSAVLYTSLPISVSAPRASL